MDNAFFVVEVGLFRCALLVGAVVLAVGYWTLRGAFALSRMGYRAIV